MSEEIGLRERLQPHLRPKNHRQGPHHALSANRCTDGPRYPTNAVAPFTLLVPIIGILAAWALQGEQPTSTQIVGGAVMLAGLAAAVIQFRPAKDSGR